MIFILENRRRTRRKTKQSSALILMYRSIEHAMQSWCTPRFRKIRPASSTQTQMYARMRLFRSFVLYIHAHSPVRPSIRVYYKNIRYVYVTDNHILYAREKKKGKPTKARKEHALSHSVRIYM